MEEGKTGLKLENTEEKLLYYLIDNKIKLITPITYYNKIEYDAVKEFEEYVDKNSFDNVLNSLTKKGYLRKTEYDRVIHCPNCDSIDQKLKYNCPQCGSIKARRFELIEHKDCGFVGELSDFKQNRRTMICPKCSTLIRKKGDLYAVIGVSYICDSCGYKFDKPDTSHHCQNCGTIFDYTNSIYNIIHTYNTTPQITELLPVREIRETLRTMESVFLENEYNVELEGMLVGKSKEEHTLSIIAEKNKDTILVDISPWGKVENFTNLLGKKMDLDPKAAIMIDLSEEEKLTPMEEIYNIKVFNGKDLELSQKLRDYIIGLETPEEPKGFFESFFEKRINGNKKNSKKVTKPQDLRDHAPTSAIPEKD
ncbi:hypothetical protein ACFL0D_04140 [Thermoproteota archaeon]